MILFLFRRSLWAIGQRGCGMRAKDLTGQRFGRLTALYPTNRRDYKGSVIWHCRCDCGNETDVPAAGKKSCKRTWGPCCTGWTAPVWNGWKNGSTAETTPAASEGSTGRDKTATGCRSDLRGDDFMWEDMTALRKPSRPGWRRRR